MKLRVLHCPTSTGGQAWQLSRAERALGIESDVLVLKSHPFGYAADRCLHLEKKNPLSAVAARIKLFSEVADRYDVFHFNYGSSLLDFPYLGLDHLDFSPLKKRGKKIFVTYQGCDARLRSYCLKNFQTSVCHMSKHWHCSAPADFVKEKRARKVFRYADKVFALNPDLLHYLPGAELMLYACAAAESPAAAKPREPGPFRILHAPSNPEIKGTETVIRAVEKLNREDFEAELLLVQNKSHDEAMKIYARADLAVDQLHAGWYGAFAAEAMALGLPVLCYLRQSDLEKYVSFRDEIPVVNTTEQDLYENLKALIQDKNRLWDLSEKGKSYAFKYHSPRAVAQAMLVHYGQRHHIIEK